MRPLKQQLKDEFAELYRKMTDPEEIRKERLKNERQERLNEQTQDYGL
jgi:putative ubiquitin-RnfH superfamily antitoxin RatB of RatAB toxin-antitoxin module